MSDAGIRFEGIATQRVDHVIHRAFGVCDLATYFLQVAYRRLLSLQEIKLISQKTNVRLEHLRVSTFLASRSKRVIAKFNAFAHLRLKELSLSLKALSSSPHLRQLT